MSRPSLREADGFRPSYELPKQRPTPGEWVAEMSASLGRDVREMSLAEFVALIATCQ